LGFDAPQACWLLGLWAYWRKYWGNCGVYSGALKGEIGAAGMLRQVLAVIVGMS
jgi:hypothetical protein